VRNRLDNAARSGATQTHRRQSRPEAGADECVYVRAGHDVRCHELPLKGVVVFPPGGSSLTRTSESANRKTTALRLEQGALVVEGRARVWRAPMNARATSIRFARVAERDALECLQRRSSMHDPVYVQGAACRPPGRDRTARGADRGGPRRGRQADCTRPGATRIDVVANLQAVALRGGWIIATAQILVGFDLGQRLAAVHAWHIEIEQDDPGTATDHGAVLAVGGPPAHEVAPLIR
jgi:hypothetical protein